MSKTMTTAEKLAREFCDKFGYFPEGNAHHAFIAGFQAGVESAQLELRRAMVEIDELRYQRHYMCALCATGSFEEKKKEIKLRESEFDREIEFKKSEVV